MKLLLLAALGLISVSTAQAQTRFLPPNSDGINLAKILLNPETQKCLSAKGFDGSDIMNHVRKAMIDEKDGVTTYIISVDHYTINPVRTRAGSRSQITCSFGKIPGEG